MSDLTREAITYFESQKKRLEDFREIYPSPNTVGYQATTKEISFYDMAISALSENKCFEGMTNGEVIQALFPNETMFEQTETCTYYGNMRFDTEWWDAPYQKGGEEMTREEAISTLEMLRFPEPWEQKLTKRAEEALDMAISALSAEGEYIKKEHILNELGDTNMDILTDEVKEIVNGLPTYSFPDSAENKGDLISRQAVLNGIAEWIADGYADSVADCSHISSLVSHLPSVENKGEWIPVSERLPKAYQKILVTYEEIHWANEPITYGVKLISFGGVVDFIAWQALPEPYKAESEVAE